ncbi:Flagellar basal-body rod protein FlgG [Gemmata sp. SH-PL17]|uniref:flagellar basal-body rod protein FlgG n=1 Tax=Gemmata sp. SH-PL17 TaxID=1630693 RepID=UPI00078EA1F4|nr:flagellar basal-body rod protein FlgG [Gemmata sp. SH-PL17]AMV25016.1 Flagellar basal-body rod protein FlgG [Gemmata sp. SH-PL17]
MIKALFTSATGMSVQTTSIDNTSNNIANVNTNGFKKGQADFQDLIYVNQRTPGSDAAQGLQVPTGLQIGSGARVAGITKVFTEGALVNTQNPFDVAVEGEGFFQVTLPSGELRYTRDGALRLNAQGSLVTSDGFLISPQITIPTSAVAVSVGSDGTISVQNAGALNASTVLGQLTLVRFQNPAGLSAEGRNLFAETASSGAPLIATPGQNGVGLTRQGFLERSNVDVVTELVNLILAQRAYEFNTRAVRTADNMLASTTDLIR